MIHVNEKVGNQILKAVGNTNVVAQNTSDGSSTKSVDDEIIKLHLEIEGYEKTSLPKAVRIGELLTKRKKELGHGNFTPWLRETVKIEHRTAQNYMKVYKHQTRLKNENVSYLSEAYQKVSEFAHEEKDGNPPNNSPSSTKPKSKAPGKTDRPEDEAEPEADQANDRVQEIEALAEYYVKGFSNGEKLDEHALKFFILRWNENRPECEITRADVQAQIDKLRTSDSDLAISA